MATLDVLLDRRNCWEQSINLQVFRDAKDIFLNQLPQAASLKQDFIVEPGAVKESIAHMLPKSLFEIALALLIFLTTMSTITTMTTPTTMEGRVFVRVLANMHKGHNGGKCVMLNCKRFKITIIVSKPSCYLVTRKNSLNVLER